MSHYCPSCGTVCDDGKVYCPNCGTPQQPTAQAAAQQPNAQQSYQQPPYQQPTYQQPPYQQGPSYAPNQPYAPVTNQPNGISNELPMKWFKFIIYFQLFANCVLNAISAIMALTGGQYQGAADMVYSYIDGLKTVDTIYGVALLAIAVFAIYVRMRLAKFCVDGPKFYYILLAAQMAANVIYLIAVNSTVSNSIVAAYYEPDYTSTISNLVTSAIMLACNIVYFKKRMHLFVNN